MQEKEVLKRLEETEEFCQESWRTSENLSKKVQKLEEVNAKQHKDIQTLKKMFLELLSECEKFSDMEQKIRYELCFMNLM